MNAIANPQILCRFEQWQQQLRPKMDSNRAFASVAGGRLSGAKSGPKTGQTLNIVHKSAKVRQWNLWLM
jgi:hypothetical protein